MKSPKAALFLACLAFTATAHAGAWAHTSFANDDALDWVANELEPRGQRAVEATLARVAKGTGYLEASDACYAIAACEVLAAAQGRPGPDLPADVTALSKKLPPKPGEPVRKNARDALDRILGKDSELRELWRDAKDDFEKWKKAVEDLKARV